MTKTELLLFEKIIESAVKKAVNEAVSEMEKSFKKDLRELKLLNAKVLKESNNQTPMFKPVQKSKNLNALLNESGEYRTISRTTENVAPIQTYQSVLPASMADHYEKSGTLPDIDAPIFFDPNSDIMREIKEKYK